MKCFELGTPSSPGFLVERDASGGLFVSAKLRAISQSHPGSKLRLCPELAVMFEKTGWGGLFEHRDSRIMRCDFGFTSEPWLVVPDGKSDDDACVLVIYHITPSHSNSDPNIRLVCEEGAKALYEFSGSARDAERQSAGVMAVVRMKPGSKIWVNATWLNPKSWIRDTKRRFDNTCWTYQDGSLVDVKQIGEFP